MVDIAKVKSLADALSEEIRHGNFDADIEDLGDHKEISIYPTDGEDSVAVITVFN